MARCKCSWDLLDKTVMPSAYEQVKSGGKNLRTDGESMVPFFQKKLVLIFKCAHCGDIRKEVESCPE